MRQLDLRNWILALLVGVLFSSASLAGAEQDSSREKVVEYLQVYLKALNERPGSLQNRFTEFLPLSPDLESALLNAFPQHRFYIAKTLFSHWRHDDGKANILIVTDAESGQVLGHKWQLRFSGQTESFNHILSAYQAQSPGDAVQKVELLSKLVVSMSNWGAEWKPNAQIKDRTITSEIFRDENFRLVLKAKIDKKNRFGRMAFVVLKDV